MAISTPMLLPRHRTSTTVMIEMRLCRAFNLPSRPMWLMRMLLSLSLCRRDLFLMGKGMGMEILEMEMEMGLCLTDGDKWEF